MGKRKQAEPEEQEAAAAATANEEDVEPLALGSEDGSEPGSSGSGGGSSGSGSEDGSSSDGDGSSSGPEVSDEPDDQDGSDDPDAFDKIDVNFQFFDPKEHDFHGLKALLHSYLDGQQYDGSPLVEAIIAQSSVGTVVRTAEEDDPIAVMTVLNTRQHKQAAFMEQIRDYMISKCSEQATRQQLIKAWDGSSTGLIINERLINCPPQLAPPLVQALFSEIEWATEDEPTQERRDFFKFKHYVLMTRVYADPLPAPQQQQQQQQGGAAAGSSKGSKAGKPPAGPSMPPPAPRQQQQPPKKQKKQDSGQGSAPNVIVYVRPEDEFFHKHATASFTFPVEGKAVAKDELQPLRLVMLLPAAKVPAARAALDAVVGNMAAQ